MDKNRENNYDYLTGLPSMTYFFDLAERAGFFHEA